MTDLLKASEVARMLAINIRTLHRHRVAGTLPFTAIDIAPAGASRPQVRFRAEDVARFLQERTQ